MDIADDVLDRHHKKNGRPRHPDPASLELLRHAVETKEDLTPSNSRGLVNERQLTRAKRPADGRKPTQFAFYPARWKNFLEDAKGECRAQHAMENPLVEDLTGSITESLTTVRVMWNRDGTQFEPSELLVF